MTRIFRTTVASTGPFPTTARPDWSAAELTRWQTARSIADAHPGNAPGGWTEESAGHFPGTYRAFACWAASPVAGLTVMHAAEPVIGQPWALYLAGGVGAGMVATGGLIHMVVWGGYRPAADPTTADQAVVDQATVVDQALGVLLGLDAAAARLIVRALAGLRAQVEAALRRLDQATTPPATAGPATTAVDPALDGPVAAPVAADVLTFDQVLADWLGSEPPTETEVRR